MATPKTAPAQQALSPQSYTVCNQGSIAYKGACFMPGQTIPAGVLPTQAALQLIKDGRIRVVGAAPAPVVAPAAPAKVGVSEKDFAAGKSSADVQPAGGSTAAAAVAIAQLKATRGEAPVATAPVAPVVAPPQAQTVQEAPAPSGPWSHDPDSLVGKPIDELRQLARDIDRTVEVDHLDEVELVVLLSADFKPLAQQG